MQYLRYVCSKLFKTGLSFFICLWCRSWPGLNLEVCAHIALTFAHIIFCSGATNLAIHQVKWQKNRVLPSPYESSHMCVHQFMLGHPWYCFRCKLILLHHGDDSNLQFLWFAAHLSITAWLEPALSNMGQEGSAGISTNWLLIDSLKYGN